jgi:hypothetical protein
MALALPPQAHHPHTEALSLLLSSSSFVAQLALRLASTGSGHRSESIDLLRIRVMMMALSGAPQRARAVTVLRPRPGLTCGPFAGKTPTPVLVPARLRVPGLPSRPRGMRLT